MPRFIVIDTGDIGRIAQRLKYVRKTTLKDILYDFAVKVTEPVKNAIVVENTYPSYSSCNNTLKSIITSPTVLKDIPSNDYRIEPSPTYNDKGILELINRWDNLELRSHRLKNTKTFKNDYQSLVKLTNGTAFNHIVGIDPMYVNKKFNSLQWDIAIERFAKAVKDVAYYPIDKSQIAKHSIADFIFSPYLINNTNKTGSNFLWYLNNEPIPYLPNNDYPLITESFIELFAKKYPDCPLTIEDRRDLIKASNQTGQFFENNEKNIVRCDRRFRQPYQKAEIVFRAVEPALPADLTPPYIYTDKLVKFIDRIGLWRS